MQEPLVTPLGAVPRTAHKAPRSGKLAALVCGLAVVAVVAVVATIWTGRRAEQHASTGSPEAHANEAVLRPADGAVAAPVAAATPGRLAVDNTTVCWKDTYTRGAGTVPTSCPAGQENDAGLCYPYCRDGFYGVGPVCWQKCPEGWVDEGALCREEGSIKTIAKQTYGRGVGKMPICAADEQEDAGLCYPQCKSGYSAVGPVCWDHCPQLDPTDGGAICCRNTTVCNAKITSLSLSLPLAIARAILAGGDPSQEIEAVKEAIQAILGFVMPTCDHLQPKKH